MIREIIRRIRHNLAFWIMDKKTKEGIKSTEEIYNWYMKRKHDD